MMLAVGAFACVRLGDASPVKGTIAVSRRLDGSEALPVTVRFKGGQRACVVVMGDHKPVVPITVEVRDDKGNVVALDEPAKGTERSSTPGNDVCAVIWYPPRDADYTITIHNHGEEWNKCWIAVR
jgi:hypothetical protein